MHLLTRTHRVLPLFLQKGLALNFAILCCCISINAQAVEPAGQTGQVSQLISLLDSSAFRNMSERSKIDEKNAITSASMARSPEEQIVAYKQYIQEHPIGEPTVLMKNRLASAYMHTKRYPEAQRILDDLIQELGNDRFVNILKINRAYLNMLSGNTTESEVELLQVMDSPTTSPDLSDPYELAPQAFVAPAYLAKLYASQGNFNKADQLLKECAIRAKELYALHKEVEWAIPYYASAYADRINLALQQDRNNKSQAQQILAELKQTMPSWTPRALDIYASAELAISGGGTIPPLPN